MPLPIPRVKLLGWAMFEVLASADVTQLDINIELLDGYIDTIMARPIVYASEVGAQDDDAFDNVTAIQDAWDTLHADGGGDFIFDYVDAGVYRVAANLLAYPTINVKFEPGVSLVIDHATENLIEWNTAAAVAIPCVWEGGILDCAQANTGTLILNSAQVVHVVFRNMLINSSGFCSNRMFYSPPASTFRFENCQALVALNNPGFRSDLGLLEIIGGKYQTPTTYADAMVTGTGGIHRLVDVHFDTSPTTGGNAVCYALAGADAHIHGCHFDDGSGNDNVAIQIQTAANAGKMTAGPCRYTNITPVEMTGGYLAEGSSIDLPDHDSGTTSTGAFTVPATAKKFSLRFTYASTAAPEVTFDPPLFHGQEMEIMIGNDHTSAYSDDLGFVGVSYDDADPALGSLAADSTSRFFGKLTAYRYEGGLAWYMTNQNHVVLV